jgi:hypothetical protein
MPIAPLFLPGVGVTIWQIIGQTIRDYFAFQLAIVARVIRHNQPAYELAAPAFRTM